LALGLAAFGEVGFRATNRQALRARAVSRNPTIAVVHYADVAVEALASNNLPDARAFVAHELRGIDDNSPTSQRLRETITAYFAAEHNAASAAATLGVHQQTVANRLRVAEERVGHPVGARRVELETALRLRSLLNDVDPY
jgi:DNA-binding PucR family transcriptional regulator